MLGFVSDLVWGSVEPWQLLKSLGALFPQFLFERGQAILADLLQGIEPYIATAGLFGNPDEIEKSGIEALATISEGDLLKGRLFYQFVISMADSASRGSEFLPPDIPPALGGAFSKIARTLRESDEWCVAGLATCSIVAHRAAAAATDRN
jgi:hypothetical protein